MRANPGYLSGEALEARLITELGVWFDPVLHSRVPFLLPHVVRDNSCRGKRHQAQDMWSSADPVGYLRDDNSFIKDLRTQLRVVSAGNPDYDGALLGAGYVACHVWASPKLAGA